MTQCLLIDESFEERRELSRLFAGFGFKLTETADAEDALKRCRAQAPDVVVMGSRAPADLVKRLRRSNGGKAPVVLVCADRPDTETIGRLIMDGAAECLLKPFDRDLLAFKLRQVGLL